MRLLLLFALCFSTLSLHAEYLIQGPMVGATQSDSVKIWCALDGKGKLMIEWSERADFKESRRLLKEDFLMGVLELDKLKPETTYYYRLGFAARRGKAAVLRPPTWPRPLSPDAFQARASSHRRLLKPAMRVTLGHIPPTQVLPANLKDHHSRGTARRGLSAPGSC